MIRKTLFASFIALGAAAGGAQAYDPGPWAVNNGGDLQIVYGPGRGNVAGGSHATITGSGENMTYHAAPNARAQQTGLVARLIGSGDEAQVVYERAAPATTMLAGTTGR